MANMADVLQQHKKKGKLPRSPAFKGKMQKVMHEFKHDQLHSGSKKGRKVSSRKQAIAIGINEGKKAASGGY